jgi:hypothetical protein
VNPGDQALAAALAGEYAAIFGYGVLGPQLTGAALVQARQAEGAHRNRRDALLETLTSAGATPPPADPAYQLPFPVIDAASAIRLALTLEERTAAVWRAALPATTAARRKTALDALTDAALRAARWRRLTGQLPGTVALPGSSD